MDQWIAKKQDWLQRDTIKEKGYTLMRPLAQLLSPQPFASFLVWLLSHIGQFVNSTLKMPSFMVLQETIHMEPPQDSLIPPIPIMSANLTRPSFVSNKPHGLGLIDLDYFFYVWDFSIALQIPHFLYFTAQVGQYYYTLICGRHQSH